MKKWSVPALALSLALVAAGCSSTSSADSEKKESEFVSSEVSKAPVETTVDTAEFDKVQEAFTNGGYTVSEVKDENGSRSFTAENANGAIEVKVEVGADSSAAAKLYDDSGIALEAEDYLEANAYSSDGKQVRELINDYNTVYALIGYDEAANTVITMQDILEPGRTDAFNVLSALGYPVE